MIVPVHSEDVCARYRGTEPTRTLRNVLLHQGLYQAALRHGATEQELMEAIWVAAEMRAGGAYAHSALAINRLSKATANSA
jgi:alkylhydroperoxidase/carboxymuconolactone decarboxylase family protein YurZ